MLNQISALLLLIFLSFSAFANCFTEVFDDVVKWGDPPRPMNVLKTKKDSIFSFEGQSKTVQGRIVGTEPDHYLIHDIATGKTLRVSKNIKKKAVFFSGDEVEFTSFSGNKYRGQVLDESDNVIRIKRADGSLVGLDKTRLDLAQTKTISPIQPGTKVTFVSKSGNEYTIVYEGDMGDLILAADGNALKKHRLDLSKTRFADEAGDAERAAKAAAESAERARTAAIVDELDRAFESEIAELQSLQRQMNRLVPGSLGHDALKAQARSQARKVLSKFHPDRISNFDPKGSSVVSEKLNELAKRVTPILNN